MPFYVQLCLVCGNEFEVMCSIAERDQPTFCLGCKALTKRIPSAPRLDIFQPYHDEALGCDISSRTEKRAVMRELGVVEAGDRVHGAINFDKHAPHHVKPLPLQGVQHARLREGAGMQQLVETVDREGRTVDRAKFGDLASV